MEMDVLTFLAVAIDGHLDLHPAGFAPEGIALLGWRDPDLGTGLRHLLGDGIDAHGWPLSGDGKYPRGGGAANNQTRDHEPLEFIEGDLVAGAVVELGRLGQLVV